MMDVSDFALVFMPFWLIGIPFLIVGAVSGLVGLANAWAGDFETARRLSWYCAVPGGIVGLLLMAFLTAVGGPMPWLFAIPALLGALTQAHLLLARSTTKLARFQFTIPAVMYATLLVAIFAAGLNYWFADHTDYSMRDEIEANLRSIDTIENVRAVGRATNGEFYVHQIEFSLAGRPDTLVCLAPNEDFRTCTRDSSLSRVDLRQVERWNLDGTYHPNGLSDTKSIDGFNVGHGSDFAKQFPFPLCSIDNIVDHYDELVEILEQWPREDQPGNMTYPYFRVEYWVEERDKPAKHP